MTAKQMTKMLKKAGQEAKLMERQQLEDCYAAAITNWSQCIDEHNDTKKDVIELNTVIRMAYLHQLGKLHPAQHKLLSGLLARHRGRAL